MYVNFIHIYEDKHKRYLLNVICTIAFLSVRARARARTRVHERSECTDLRSVMFASLMLARGPGMLANHWTRIKTLKRAKPRFSKPAFPLAPIFPTPSKIPSQPLRRLHIRTHSRHEIPVDVFACVQSSTFIDDRGNAVSSRSSRK